MKQLSLWSILCFAIYACSNPTTEMPPTEPIENGLELQTETNTATKTWEDCLNESEMAMLKKLVVAFEDFLVYNAFAEADNIDAGYEEFLKTLMTTPDAINVFSNNSEKLSPLLPEVDESGILSVFFHAKGAAPQLIDLNDRANFNYNADGKRLQCLATTKYHEWANAKIKAGHIRVGDKAMGHIVAMEEEKEGISLTFKAIVMVDFFLEEGLILR